MIDHTHAYVVEPGVHEVTKKVYVTEPFDSEMDVTEPAEEFKDEETKLFDGAQPESPAEGVENLGKSRFCWRPCGDRFIRVDIYPGPDSCITAYYTIEDWKERGNSLVCFYRELAIELSSRVIDFVL